MRIEGKEGASGMRETFETSIELNIPGSLELADPLLVWKTTLAWVTPSETLEFSRSSALVCPLALHGSLLSRNLESVTQPPPTRTITVLFRKRTKHIFPFSPNWNGEQHDLCLIYRIWKMSLSNSIHMKTIWAHCVKVWQGWGGGL